MRFICDHILDIMQNALAADANLIRVRVSADSEQDTFCVLVEDNGHAISETMAKSVGDPFTVRQDGHIGLGLALLDASTQRANGRLIVHPLSTEGTAVEFSYALAHVDRPPVGDLAGALHVTMVCNPHMDFMVDLCVWPGEREKLDTCEIRREVGEDMRLDEPAISAWIQAKLQHMFALLQ